MTVHESAKADGHNLAPPFRVGDSKSAAGGLEGGRGSGRRLVFRPRPLVFRPRPLARPPPQAGAGPRVKLPPLGGVADDEVGRRGAGKDAGFSPPAAGAATPESRGRTPLQTTLASMGITESSFKLPPLGGVADDEVGRRGAGKEAGFSPPAAGASTPAR